MRIFRIHDTRNAVRFVLGGALVGAALAVIAVAACVPNPDIDGSQVAPIGSDASVPTCEPLCQRLAALCGYAPVDCVAACNEGYGDDQKLCIGRAPSCQAALQECAPPPEEEGDAGDDAEGESEEDGGDDAGEDDAGEDDSGDQDATDLDAPSTVDAPMDANEAG